MSLEILYLRWLLVANLLALVLFAVDKGCAKRGWRRIPEVILIWIILLGGAFGGALGCWVFRHKTRKFKFAVALVVGVVIHGGLLWIRWRGAGLPF